MLCAAVSASMTALHFMLLGNGVAAIIFLLISIRVLFALRWPRHPALFGLFTLAGLALGIAHAEDMTALFPITAFLLANTAYFWLDWLPMRIVFILASSSMLINALLSGSASAAIGEVVAIGLHLKAIHTLNRHTAVSSTD